MYLFTGLSRITEVKVTRSLTQLAITWKKLNKTNIYDYILLDSHGSENNFSGSSVENEYTHVYSTLTPGTVYNFTLFTQVNGHRNGFAIKSITSKFC